MKVVVAGCGHVMTFEHLSLNDTDLYQRVKFCCRCAVYGHVQHPEEYDTVKCLSHSPRKDA